MDFQSKVYQIFRKHGYQSCVVNENTASYDPNEDGNYGALMKELNRTFNILMIDNKPNKTIIVFVNISSVY